jgi:hypothetical protein
MKNKSFSIPEILLIFFIINTTLIVFLRLSSDYLKTLVFSKELFILNSALNEKYQMAIAYKNLAYADKNTTSLVFDTGTNINYCFEFDTSNYRIITSTASDYCEYKFLNGEKPGINYKLNFTDYYEEQALDYSFFIQILHLKITGFSPKNDLTKEIYSSLISGIQL